MAKIGLPKGSGKRLKVREKTVKSQGILKWILSGNPDKGTILQRNFSMVISYNSFVKFHGKKMWAPQHEQGVL